MTITSIIFYLLLGIISGIFSATFGVGGGVIVVPALTFFVAMSQKDAQGTALAIMIPMAIMGALRYHLNPEIHLDWRVIAILGIAAIIGANIGAEVVGRVSNKTLQFGFGCFVLIVAIRMIWQSFQPTV
jgi:uncharacterized membrane protein YfcA